MPAFFAFCIGIGVPSFTGWLFIRALEGPRRFLGRPLCCALGFLLGTMISMFSLFLLSGVLRFSLTKTSILITEGFLFLLSMVGWLLRCKKTDSAALGPHASPLSPWQWCVVTSLGAWTAFKVTVAASTFLLLVPTYLDDTFDNWNLRAKVFHHTQSFTLQLPRETLQESITGISAYPPMVPLFKASLTLLHGTWSEALANSVHVLWYFCILALIFGALKRLTALPWALLGTYGFASLPLPLLHGTNAYAEMFLSAHIFAALIPLALAWHTNEEHERIVFLSISAVFMAFLPFTKNEGTLLYLPPMLLIFVASLWRMAGRSLLQPKTATALFLWSAGLLLAFTLPWLLFKWGNGMSFGNAKPVGSLDFSWQEMVLQAITVNTLFEGNWLLLFPFLFALLLLQRRYAFSSPLLPFTAFFLILYLGQMPIFMFTPLSTEAIRQTGYARGLVHLAPVAVSLTTALLALLWNEKVRKE